MECRSSIERWGDVGECIKMSLFGGPGGGRRVGGRGGGWRKRNIILRLTFHRQANCDAMTVMVLAT